MKSNKNIRIKKEPFFKNKSKLFLIILFITSVVTLILNVILIFIYHNYQWFVLSNFNFGGLPTWLAAIGSTGTLIFMVYQLHKDRKDRKLERLQQQAQKIYAYIVSGNNPYYALTRLVNLSSAPVYNVVITLVLVHGQIPHDGRELWVSGSSSWGKYINILTPGKFQTVEGIELDAGMSRRWGVEIAFRDLDGQSWVIDGHGHLHEIKEDPLEYYDVSIPRPSSGITEI